MVWFIIIAINIASIVIFIATTKYLDYIDRKAQKHFEMTHLMLNYIERNKEKN